MQQPKSQQSSLLSQGRHVFDYDDLIACAEGKLFGPGNPQLPLPPMLMFDRISHITGTGGIWNRGFATAELAVKPDQWFFGCHFLSDPVMPGCLGIDALWQLLGFFLGWQGGTGHGRALGSGKVRFSDQILPSNSSVEFRIDIKRVVRVGLHLGIAKGEVRCDGKVIYTVEDLRAGLFEK